MLDIKNFLGNGFLYWVSKEDFLVYAKEKDISQKAAEEMFSYYEKMSNIVLENISSDDDIELVLKAPKMAELHEWTFTDDFTDIYEKYGGFEPYDLWCIAHAKEIVPLSEGPYPNYLSWLLHGDLAPYVYTVDGGWKYSEEAPLNPPPKSVLPYLTRHEIEIGEGPITIVGDTLDEDLPPMTINLSDWLNIEQTDDGKYYYYILDAEAGPLKACEALPLSEGKYHYCYKTLKIYCGTTLKLEMTAKKFHILRIEFDPDEGFWPDPVVIQFVD